MKTKTNKIIKNWEYYSKKYNLMLDNENYEDLERAFEEVTEQALAKQREEFKEEFKRMIKGKKVKWIKSELPKIEEDRIERIINAVLTDILKTIKNL